MLLNKKQKK